jgi:hypothetical protein
MAVGGHTYAALRCAAKPSVMFYEVFMKIFEKFKKKLQNTGVMRKRFMQLS